MSKLFFFVILGLKNAATISNLRSEKKIKKWQVSKTTKEEPCAHIYEMMGH